MPGWVLIARNQASREMGGNIYMPLIALRQVLAAQGLAIVDEASAGEPAGERYWRERCIENQSRADLAEHIVGELKAERTRRGAKWS